MPNSYEEYICEHCGETINLLENSEDFYTDEEGNRLMTDFVCPECHNYVQGETIYL